MWEGDVAKSSGGNSEQENQKNHDNNNNCYYSLQCIDQKIFFKADS